MRLPAAVDAMRGMGVDIELSTPEEFGRLIESEMQRWGSDMTPPCSTIVFPG
jgi:hypothetical protein